MTSVEFKTTSNEPGKHTSNKRNENVLKGGSMHENIENNDEYLDEILDNSNL